MRFSIIFPSLLILVACNRSQQKVDIPDIVQLNNNIQYLDSLLQSNQVDSIAAMITQAETLVALKSSQVQSPDDAAILDSINRIISGGSEFLRFCIDSRTNIGILRQDIASVDAQHKSRKIQTGQFIRSLIESEQILVDINNRFENEQAAVMHSLRNISTLQAMLKPEEVSY